MRKRHCDVPGEPKGPPRKRKRSGTVTSPRRDKGKQKAREPSPAASDEWEDADNISELIAAVNSTHNAMDKNAAMERVALGKLRKTIAERERAAEEWWEEQRQMWEEQREMWVEERLGRKAMLNSLSVLRSIMAKVGNRLRMGAEPAEEGGVDVFANPAVVQAAGVLMAANDSGMLRGRFPADDRMEEDDATDGEGEEQAGDSSEV
jgi:hypothetical protein